MTATGCTVAIRNLWRPSMTETYAYTTELEQRPIAAAPTHATAAGTQDLVKAAL